LGKSKQKTVLFDCAKRTRNAVRLLRKLTFLKKKEREKKEKKRAAKLSRSAASS